MSSYVLSGAENITLTRGKTPYRYGFMGSSLHGRCLRLPKMGLVPYPYAKTTTRIPRCSLSSSRPASQPRFIQHKQEAFWFYRFLSIVYDHVINPGHWTEDMRDDALEPADLNDPGMKVVDVGGGTGFTTLGIIKQVEPKNVTILDQSPHQLDKARQKEALKECTIIEGDAGTSHSILIMRTDMYRLEDMWMLFPKEEEYIEWFEKAGFEDVRLKRIGPKWYRGVRRHGLIMGCSLTGVKRASGDSPLQLGPKAEDVSKPMNPFSFLLRFLIGTIAATYFVLVPIYMWIKDQTVPKDVPV